MAQLERYYSATVSVSAGDGAYHTLPAFPTIAAGTSLLIKSVYFYFDAAYYDNISALRATNTAVDYNIIETLQGSITANTTALIPPDSEFVLIAGDVFKYRFTNVNPGNLSITVFYCLIPGQAEDKSIKFNAIRGVLTPSSTTITSGIASNIVFIKSLRVGNNSATDTFEVLFGSKYIKSRSIVQFTDTALISKSDNLYLTSTQDLNVDSTSFSNGYYYFSYYYDPLYDA